MTRPTPVESDISARPQRSIQSVEVGGRLLVALTESGRAMALKDLARAADMTASSAHPYLVSFCKLGLIAQDAASGTYGLGPLAMQLGLISLQQFDSVRLATPFIAELAQETGHTVALAVWGNRGPTIVRIEHAPTAIHVNMRHGTVMSLRGTASGRLFAAFMPQHEVEGALQDEFAYETRMGTRPSAASMKMDSGFRKELALVRSQGISCMVDGSVPGVSAVSAPVFNETGQIVLGLTAIGPSAIFNAEIDGPVAQALTRRATELSRRLGAKDTKGPQAAT